MKPNNHHNSVNVQDLNYQQPTNFVGPYKNNKPNNSNKFSQPQVLGARSGSQLVGLGEAGAVLTDGQMKISNGKTGGIISHINIDRSYE
jgi:hypothetical protein